MRASKAKAIRRAMRDAVDAGTTVGWIAHPKRYPNARGRMVLRYMFQYVSRGGDKLVKLGKKIYDASGVLPRRPK